MAIACDMPVAPSSQAYWSAITGHRQTTGPHRREQRIDRDQDRVPPENPDISKALDHVHQEAIDQIENGRHAFPTKMMR